MGYMVISSAGSSSRAMVWDAVLLAAVAVLAVAVLAVAVLAARRLYWKWLKAYAVEVFSIEKLQALRDSGQISEDEFATLRRTALGLRQSAHENDKSKSSTTTEVDDGRIDTEEG